MAVCGSCQLSGYIGAACPHHQFPSSYPSQADADDLQRALAQQAIKHAGNNSPRGDTMTLDHLDRLVRLQGQVLNDMVEVVTNLKDAVWALNDKVRALEAREEVR